jgi:folate-dependent phosphoribosylglycinamide formyltransferase PurN
LEELDDGNIVLKKKVRSRDEKPKTLQETIVERLTAEMHGAFNSIVMSLQSE